METKHRNLDLWIPILFIVLSIIPVLNILLFSPLAIYFSVRAYRKAKGAHSPKPIMFLVAAVAAWSFMVYSLAVFFFVISTDTPVFRIAWTAISIAAACYALYRSVCSPLK